MDEQWKQQLENLKYENADPSVINDVIENGLEAHPGAIENQVGRESMTEMEKSIVNHTVDGKTWNTDRR